MSFLASLAALVALVVSAYLSCRVAARVAQSWWDRQQRRQHEHDVFLRIASRELRHRLSRSVTRCQRCGFERDDETGEWVGAAAIMPGVEVYKMTCPRCVNAARALRSVS